MSRRPKQEGVRLSGSLTVRVSEQSLDRVREKARESGLSTADYMRALIDDAGGKEACDEGSR